MSSKQIEKPLLRGHFHQAAFFIAIGSCATLIANSFSMGRVVFVSTFIYSLTLIILFGVSALYHRPQWSDKKRAVMKRLDHAAIFLVIAGTCVPIVMLGIGGVVGQKLLILIVTACLAGLLKEFIWISSPKWLTALLYVGVGWIIIPYSSQLLPALGTFNFALLLSGGIFFTVGALFYAFKRPNFYPKVFGYHEVFHLMVVLGAVFHFVMVYRLIHRIF